ncbi:hypothetical protein EYZ11_008903 [Aspergillus tanneri]|uniref:DUF7136 domain-containing protein n=1 Tax=Aspergillus tanneri TaxID=1220188 RepID=A0A4S3J9D0_9EURO|nr:hypothetical protein EYZ11_008903 [Aspergillus tanneri]
MQVPMWVEWSGGDYTNDTCAVVASSTPTPTPDPCRVNIDSTIVASMSASLKARLCNGLNPPADCLEDDESAAQQLAVFGVSCLLAAFGTLGFFLIRPGSRTSTAPTKDMYMLWDDIEIHVTF